MERKQKRERKERDAREEGGEVEIVEACVLVGGMANQSSTKGKGRTRVRGGGGGEEGGGGGGRGGWTTERRRRRRRR